MPPDGADYTGKVATVSGWGRLKYGGGVPSVLQEVEVSKNEISREMRINLTFTTRYKIQARKESLLEINFLMYDVTEAKKFFCKINWINTKTSGWTCFPVPNETKISEKQQKSTHVFLCL